MLGTRAIAYKGSFGHSAAAVDFVLDVVFGLAIFYPSWIVNLLAVLAMPTAAFLV